MKLLIHTFRPCGSPFFCMKSLLWQSRENEVFLFGNAWWQVDMVYSWTLLLRKRHLLVPKEYGIFTTGQFVPCWLQPGMCKHLPTGQVGTTHVPGETLNHPPQSVLHFPWEDVSCSFPLSHWKHTSLQVKFALKMLSCSLLLWNFVVAIALFCRRKLYEEYSRQLVCDLGSGVGSKPQGNQGTRRTSCWYWI